MNWSERVEKLARPAVWLFIVTLQATFPAVLADPAVLYGQWGDKKQCERSLILPNGTRYASPIEIQPQWIGHGEIWCRLKWVSAGSSERAGSFAFALALCGEDDVRDYRLKFELRDNLLTLHWNEHVTNGPLQRCSTSHGE